MILDVRVPCTPVARLNNHRACVNGIAWAPHSSCHICTAGKCDLQGNSGVFNCICKILFILKFMQLSACLLLKNTCDLEALLVTLLKCYRNRCVLEFVWKVVSPVPKLCISSGYAPVILVFLSFVAIQFLHVFYYYEFH